MKTIALLILILASLAMPVCAQWETVRHKGEDYVTVRSIKKFYAFKKMDKKGKFLVLDNDAVTMKLTIGGQEVFLNNVKFIFSMNIVAHKDRYLVSRLDLAKLIDPVLRPTFIKDANAFETVIIDPGHGGKDSGAVNRFGEEKQFTLAIARLLKDELEKKKLKAVLTREGDRWLSLDERVKFANGIDNALFVSIHFESGLPGRRNPGIQTYTLSPVGAGARKARAGNAQDSSNIALAAAAHSTCLLRSGRPDRGIRRARFTVLTGVKHPAILMEAGSMSHPEEGRLINAEAYQKTLASALAEAVVKYRRAVLRRPKK